MDALFDEENFISYTDEQRALLIEFFSLRKELSERRAKYSELTLDWLANPSDPARRKSRDDYHEMLIAPYVRQLRDIRQQLLKSLVDPEQLKLLSEEFGSGLQKKLGRKFFKQLAAVMIDLSADGVNVESMKASGKAIYDTLLDSYKDSADLVTSSFAQTVKLPLLVLLFEDDFVTKDELRDAVTGKGFQR